MDEENENYADVDGILYKKVNGVVTEAVICPQQYTKYKTALSLGETAPSNAEEAAVLGAKLARDDYNSQLEKTVDDESSTTGKEIILPETVTKIDQLCFAYCDKLTSIRIPSGVKEIETMAFFKCSALTDVELPDGLETIGSDAFSKCGELTYIFIPESVKAIGHHAFFDCGKLEKVYMESADTNGMELGENWKPQYRKAVMRDREIVYGAERGVR